MTALSSRHFASAGWAFGIVTVSLIAAFSFDAGGLQWLARVALAPVFPVLLAMVAAGGGFHGVSGESGGVWVVIAVVSFVLWWGIIDGITENWQQWRKTARTTMKGLYRHIASAGLAFAIVAVSLGASNALSAADIRIGSLPPLKYLAWVAIAPFYPGLLAAIAIGGGAHEMSLERWTVPVAGVLSFVLWWGIIEWIIGTWRRRRRAVSERL